MYIFETKKIIRMLVFLYILNLSLPTNALSNNQEMTLYEQITSNVSRIYEHQSLCTPGRAWAAETDVPLGTAFIVADYRKAQDSPVHIHYIVTARHIVEEHYDLFARFQTEDNKNIAILRLPRDLWVFHPQQAPAGFFLVDVAVMKIPHRKFLMPFLLCDEDEHNFCGIDKFGSLKKNQLGYLPEIMDRTVFFGFTGSNHLFDDTKPEARAGIISYSFSNNLMIDGRKSIDNKMLYIDAPAFPGNSGGPLIHEILPHQEEIKLYGLISGSASQGKDYAIATSIERILETIDHARNHGTLDEKLWLNEPITMPIRCEAE